MEQFNRGGRWAWIALGAVAMVFALAFLDRGKAEQLRTSATTTIGEWETDPAVWGRSFPREYHSWRLGRDPADLGPGRTKRGGQLREASRLFAGFSLASAAEPKDLRHPIGCQACHDPRTMELRLSQPSFLEALARQGTAPGLLSRQDLKSYVCAQCHVTRVGQMLPLRLEGILDLTAKGEPADWNHADSGAAMLKLRHPEFELWSQGIHAQRGVSCVECHMPYQSEGSTRITSHRMQSPMLTVTSSCTTCHRWGEREFQARVAAIQDTTLALQRRASEALLAAHHALGAAGKAGIPDARLQAARSLIREAQVRWDYIASEGSTGFHAPQVAAEQLGIAIDQARQAELLARQLQVAP